MPFSDPSSGFFSPSSPSGGDVAIPRLPLQPLPELQNIGNPAKQPFEQLREVHYQPDRTLGIALKEGAEALKSSVEGLDSGFKIAAVNEVRSTLEPLFKSQIEAGLEQKQQLLSEQTERQTYLDETPAGLQKGIAQLQTVQKAARSGPISDSGLQARANELISGLKTRYPGHGAIIDQAAENLFGISAERYRSSVQRDVDSLRKAQLERTDYWTKEFFKRQGELGEGWQFRPIYENQERLRRIDSIKNGIENDRIRMEADARNGVAPWQKAANHLTWTGQIQASGMFDEFVKDMQKKDPSLTYEKVIQGNVTPPQKEIALASLRELSVQFDRTMTQYATTQTVIPSDPGGTAYNILRNQNKGDEVKKIIDTVNPFTRMIEAITADKWGVVGQEARFLSSIIDAETARFATNNQTASTWMGIATKMGPAFNTVVQQSPQLQNALKDAASEMFKLNNLQGGMPFSQLIEKYNTQRKTLSNDGGSTNPPAAAIKQSIDDKLVVLTADGQDKQFQEQHYRDVYMDPQNTYLVKGILKSPGGINDASSVFNQFIQPKITQNALNGKVSEEVKVAYVNWAKNNFSAISPRLAEEVGGRVRNSPLMSVQFDELSSTYVVTPTDLGRKRATEFNGALRNVQPSLDKLNASMKLMKPIIESTGQDFNDYVKTLPTTHALTPDWQQKKWQGGFDDPVYGKKSEIPVIDLDGGREKLKALIRKGENASKYDGMFGDKSFKATEMTVGEVLDEQKKRIAGGAKSTAVGGYQFVNETLERTVKKSGIDRNTKFTPDVQDRLADTLLSEAGYDDYKSGKITKSKMIDNLSKVWAAFPNSKGVLDPSMDNGLNKVNVSLADLIDTL